MAQNTMAGLIPRGSLGLKLLLVCMLVLVMGVPLLMVGGLVGERQTRANQVTAEIGDRAGGQQIVGGPMLLVPYQRTIETTDDQGRTQRRAERGTFVVFAETGTATADLNVSERRRGIYRAATYDATTDFTARFRPAAALAEVDPAYRFDWTGARFAMFVRDSRAIRDAAELRFPDGTTATLEPLSDLSFTAPNVEIARPGVTSTMAYAPPGNLQAFAAPAPFTTPPEEFAVETRLVLGGAQRFALAAFAQDTTVTMSGNRRDVSAEGHFQTLEPMGGSGAGSGEDEYGTGPAAPDTFTASWRVPFVARGIEKAADLNSFNVGVAAERDMAVSFVAADDIYQGVARAVRYGIMFIGIVFLATLIFEAVSGKKAHPAQYVLVGLAQCVFYLLLLSMTEIIGFNVSFLISAVATVVLLSYYAGESFKSRAVAVRALLSLTVLYGAMYVLMTLEDFALFAGAWLTFIVLAATFIATRRIDWYGRGAVESRAT